MTDTAPLQTVADVAELLQVDAERVTALINAGELLASDVSTGKRLKPRWRIAPDDVEAFLRRRSTQATEKTKKRPRQRRNNINEGDFY